MHHSRKLMLLCVSFGVLAAILSAAGAGFWALIPCRRMRGDMRPDDRDDGSRRTSSATQLNLGDRTLVGVVLRQMREAQWLRCCFCRFYVKKLMGGVVLNRGGAAAAVARRGGRGSA